LTSAESSLPMVRRASPEKADKRPFVAAGFREDAGDSRG
jgi:hypothetical protein